MVQSKVRVWKWAVICGGSVRRTDMSLIYMYLLQIAIFAICFQKGMGL